MAKAEKVLYFIDGASPSKDDYAAAEKIGRGVVFRNIRRIVPGAPLENADAVAGKVPPDYAAVYGSADGDSEKRGGMVVLRPGASRTASSGGPDDARPGTVDDGMAHESGTGSSFAGDPYKERAAAVSKPRQQQGRPVWEKNPELAEPEEMVEAGKYGANVTVPSTPSIGAWPTTGGAEEANPFAKQAPEVVKQTAKNSTEEMSKSLKEASEQSKKADEARKSNEQKSSGQRPFEDNGENSQKSTDSGGGKNSK